MDVTFAVMVGLRVVGVEAEAAGASAAAAEASGVGVELAFFFRAGLGDVLEAFVGGAFFAGFEAALLDVAFFIFRIS